MEILNEATRWAKAEIVSATYFMMFGIVYLFAAIGFWQLGSSSLTKALIIPILVAGGLLLGAGVSFYRSNQNKLKSFETEFTTNPSAIIKSEMARTTSTMKTYENVALKVFPLVILVAALLAVFMSNPTFKAICIGIIAFLAVLVLLDSQALKRIKSYHYQLELADEKFRNANSS